MESDSYKALRQKIIDQCIHNKIGHDIRLMIEKEIRDVLLKDGVTLTGSGERRLLGDVLDLVVKDLLENDF